MTNVITCTELRHRRLEELQALFRRREIELLRTQPGSFERTTALASLEHVSRATAMCQAPVGAPASDDLGGLVTLCRSRAAIRRGIGMLFRMAGRRRAEFVRDLGQV
jgi:hypothetical protein